MWNTDMHTDKTLIHIKSKTTPLKIIIIIIEWSVLQCVAVRINKATFSMLTCKDCLDIYSRKKKDAGLIMALHTLANKQ